jgi:hypothetical protein
MSFHRKISCTQCNHYTDCSQATRLFINYCGSKSKLITQKIVDACDECRIHQGYMFKQNSYIASKESEIPLAFSMAP